MKLVVTGLFIVSLLTILASCVSSAKYVSETEKMLPPIGELVTVNGARVHVIERGDADEPVVLMIHGASANAREFSWTLAPPLETDHRILMADRPGHGYSDRPADAEMLKVQAKQMAGLLDAVAPDRKAIIVGHSFGGAVALRLALDAPGKVNSLVLLAPVTHDWGEGGTQWYNNVTRTPGIGWLFSQLVPTLAPSRMEAGVASTFHPANPPENYFHNSGIGLLLRPENFRANAADVSTLKAELAAQQERYSDLDLPIVLFSGSQDTVLAPRLHAARLKNQTEIDLVILPEEGHMPHHAEKEAVVDAIRRLSKRSSSN